MTPLKATKNRKASPQGFTILEIVIAISLVALFFGSAAIFAIRRGNEDLTQLSSDIRALATSTKDTALKENRTQYIVFTPSAIWQSHDPDSEFDKALPHLAIDPEFLLSVQFDQGWIPIDKDNPRAVWLFSSSGLCEELSLKLEAENASYEYDFHPLTSQIIVEDAE